MQLQFLQCKVYCFVLSANHVAIGVFVTSTGYPKTNKTHKFAHKFVDFYPIVAIFQT